MKEPYAKRALGYALDAPWPTLRDAGVALIREAMDGRSVSEAAAYLDIDRQAFIRLLAKVEQRMEFEP